MRAYLDPKAIVAAAVKAGADAVYPGYGFLSENPDLAEECHAAGITFIGPPKEVLEPPGNKASAIAAAKAAGVPGAQVRRAVGQRRRAPGRLGRADLPAVRQGCCRRWRPWHAPGRRSGQAARIHRSGDA
ncbi:biotin carboxylase N-terminal domain-containing protein [Aeromicrobium sp. UC242_57]|uniref:biotin carboxylase N-terminal domain-containing protein n=1 Tax=Aeromicrobium sp. UC242_57 TaxID=3374624 RepID=UPI0037BD5D27